jgi:hypothetical protein
VVARAIQLAPRRGARPRAITADLVPSLALIFHYLEPVAPRAGTGESAAALVARTGADEADVAAALLAGELGPVRVLADGTPTVRPTALELTEALPEYGRREAAKTAGDWPIEETLTYREAAERYGIDPKVIRGAWSYIGRPAAKDAAGRIYILTSALPARIRTRSAVTPAEYAARYRAAVRAAVVAAGYPPDTADDFHPLAPVVNAMRQRCGAPSHAIVSRAKSDGRIATVPYRGMAHAPDAVKIQPFLVYCPCTVRETTDPALIYQWLKGEVFPPPPRHRPNPTTPP